MSVADFFKSKEKNSADSLKSSEFKRRVEPPLRQLSSRMSKHLAGRWESPWLERLAEILDREARYAQEMNEAVRACYQQWQPLIGEEVHLGDWFNLNQNVIDQFALATGDNQWIHVDPDRAARESPFGTTVAHGFLTLSLLPMLTGALEANESLYPHARLVVNQGLNKVRFPAAVKSGAWLRARTRLLDVMPAKKSVDLLQEVSVEIKGSQRLACVAESLLRIYC